MKTTLLALVQNILSSMSSDDVDSIDDTEESRQVANICEDTFYNLQAIRDWGHKLEVIQLTASGNNDQPTRMLLPVTTRRIESIWYDKQTSDDTEAKWQLISYKDPDSFLQLVLQTPTGDNVTEITDDVQSLVFRVFNDRGPTYWSSFDDEYIWFDAHDSSVDDTLQQSKTTVRAVVDVAFTKTDGATIDVPNHDWALYRELAKSRAFEEIKQTVNQSASATARRLMVRAQRNNAQRQDGEPRSINYGRK